MKIPTIMYGTAWKEEDTEQLVTLAIKSGFRAIDTANQRKHYFEEAVGNAIKKAMQEGLAREDLFIQTKFTHIEGQDHRLPYDENVNIRVQVQQSFQSSLKHLHIDYLDSYVLHGPSSGYEITPEDWEVWKEMEILHKEGKTKHLGVSNVNIKQLQQLYEGAEIKPTFVQNRCFAQLGWDQRVRNFCQENDIVYQGFSLLTANPFIVPHIMNIAKKYEKTPAQIVFQFSRQIGMLPLTGTTSEQHMLDDVNLGFTLTQEEMDFIENCAVN